MFFFKSTECDLDKTINTTDDWADLERTQQSQWPSHTNTDPRAGDVMVWFRNVAKMPEQVIYLVAHRFQQNDEVPSRTALRRILDELTREGSSNNRLQAQEVLARLINNHDGRFVDGLDEKWGTLERMVIFDVQDFCVFHFHFHVVELGDTVRFPEKLNKGMGADQASETNHRPPATCVWG